MDKSLLSNRPGLNLNPIRVTAYHGSGCAIDSFDYKFTGIGNDQNGGGFYFTTDLQEAVGYTQAQINGLAKPGGEDDPTVHVVELTFQAPMDSDAQFPISLDAVKRILKRSPNLLESLANWGDIEYEGFAKVFNEAAQAYTHQEQDGPTIKTLFKIANDFFDGETEAFNLSIKEILGIDAVTESHSDTKTHYVAFFPDQVNIIERLPVDEVRDWIDQSCWPKKTRQR